MKFQPNGYAVITQMIRKAREQGRSQVTVTGYYEVDETILIPSGMTIILEDCHLRMAAGSFCNLFTNEHCRTAQGRQADGADRDIAIIGRGRAILDGGEYNGLSERNSCKDGRPHISVNSLVLFANVDGFRISGIRLRNQRWWAMNFVYCRHGKIQDIDVFSDHTSLDADGNRVDGLHLGYQAVYIKNSDGIDIRSGCHDILIENITGFSEDDSVAVTGLNGVLETKLFPVEGLSSDIYNITIRNVNTATYCTNVRLLNQSGVRLYNILVDGVMAASKDYDFMDRGIYGVRIGDNQLYGTRHATADETMNLTVRNVFSRASLAAVSLAGAMRDLTLDTIRAFDGCPQLVINDAVIE